MPDIQLTQGQRIRYARERAGLEQEELAELLRVSRAALSGWERDRNKKGVSFNDLEAIAKHTGMDVEFLVPRVLQFSTVTGTDTGREWDEPTLFDEELQVSAGIWHPCYADAA